MTDERLYGKRAAVVCQILFVRPDHDDGIRCVSDPPEGSAAPAGMGDCGRPLLLDRQQFLFVFKDLPGEQRDFARLYFYRITAGNEYLALYTGRTSCGMDFRRRMFFGKKVEIFGITM